MPIKPVPVRRFRSTSVIRPQPRVSPISATSPPVTLPDVKRNENNDRGSADTVVRGNHRHHRDRVQSMYVPPKKLNIPEFRKFFTDSQRTELALAQLDLPSTATFVLFTAYSKRDSARQPINLNEFCQNPNFDVQFVPEIILQILKGLCEMHKAGVAYRNVNLEQKSLIFVPCIQNGERVWRLGFDDFTKALVEKTYVRSDDFIYDLYGVGHLFLSLLRKDNNEFGPLTMSLEVLEKLSSPSGSLEQAEAVAKRYGDPKNYFSTATGGRESAAIWKGILASMRDNSSLRSFASLILRMLNLHQGDQSQFGSTNRWATAFLSEMKELMQGSKWDRDQVQKEMQDSLNAFSKTHKTDGLHDVESLARFSRDRYRTCHQLSSRRGLNQLLKTIERKERC